MCTHIRNKRIMNFGSYISLLILNGCVCIVTSIHVCSNQTEFGRTVYLSRDQRDVTQCQCDVTSSQMLDSRIGFHRQWFPNACGFDFFVTVNSFRYTYSCKDFEDKYFNLSPRKAVTISLESNSDIDLFDFDLAVHSYTDNATLILECYEQQYSGEPGTTGHTTSGTPISSSPGTGNTELGVGEIIGIVIGIIVLIIIIVIIIVICLIKKRKDKTYADATRHDHDIHVYDSVAPGTMISPQGSYDNFGMESTTDDIVPELPMRDFIPTISDVNSNTRHDYDNQNLETVIDSPSPKQDKRSTESIQPSIDSSSNPQDVDVDYLQPSDMTLPAHLERAVNLQGEHPTVLGDDGDAEKYSKVTIIESSII